MSSAAPSSPLRTKDFLKIHESKTEELNPTRSLTSNDGDGDGDDDNPDLPSDSGVGLFTKESFRLFRKLPQLSNPQSLSDKGKAKMEHSRISRGYMLHGLGPLVAPKNGSNDPRPLSMLEKRLLPEIEERTIQLSSSGDMSETSQLTIFYRGAVHVHNNVPTDKAQAIMLLARESSVSKTKTSDEKKEVQEMEKWSPKPKPKPGPSNPFGFPASMCKLQVEELPIARKNSISHFLKKRRERITNKSPYTASARASSSNSPRPTKQKENDASSSKDKEAMVAEGLDVNKTVSLSPFPSRLGSFCPKPANKTK